MPIFRVKSVKIYTGQKKIYTGMPVAPVTNIRYDITHTLYAQNLHICYMCWLNQETCTHARVYDTFFGIAVKIMLYRTRKCSLVCLWFPFFNCFLVIFVIVFQKPSFSRKLLFTLDAIVKSTAIPMRSIYVVSQRCRICVSLRANLAFENPLFEMKCSNM